MSFRIRLTISYDQGLKFVNFLQFSHFRQNFLAKSGKFFFQKISIFTENGQIAKKEETIIQTHSLLTENGQIAKN